jgi:peroxiredoxin/tetratricopeptide (TPR) repeat protein
MIKKLWGIIALVFIISISAAAQVTKIEPEKPKWGDLLKITYNPAAPGAVFAPTDGVYALYFVYGPERRGWARMDKSRDVLTARIPVEKNAYYITISFITLERQDTGAGLNVMIFRPDGKPARGAYHREMLRNFSPETYLELFFKERALYPDYYAIFRDKWFVERAIKELGHQDIIHKDMEELKAQRLSKESIELLYSLSYGHLLLGEEEAAREILRRLVDIAPDNVFTARALDDYEHQFSANHWKGEWLEEIKNLEVRLMTEFPGSRQFRRLFESSELGPEMTFETSRAFHEAWIKDEPDNPLPYYFLARTAKLKNRDMKNAAGIIRKAIDLLLQGKLRFYGDASGRLTQLRIPSFYSLSAQIHRDIQEYGRALADIKAAQAINKDTRPDYLVTEASIWSELGLIQRAEEYLLDALKQGDKDAEGKLKDIYQRQFGKMDGFAEYLADKLKRLSSGTSSPSIRKPAPDFTVKTLDGKEIRLSDLRGKVVILNFWFVGCAPCKVEMPGLNKLTEEFAGQDIVFIGFALDKADLLREFLKVNSFKYQIVAESASITEQFGVSVFPTHIMINKNGEVEYFLTGGSANRDEELRALIRNLL